MQDFDKFNKIQMFDYPNCDYITTINYHFDDFNQFLKSGCTVWQSVNGHYYYGFDYSMDQNCMDKFVAMIAGMLFMMEHNDVEPDQAYGTNYDINVFESGEYDDLFTPEDLALLKKDIKKIKDYLSEHPELLEE